MRRGLHQLRQAAPGLHHRARSSAWHPPSPKVYRINGLSLEPIQQLARHPCRPPRTPPPAALPASIRRSPRRLVQIPAWPAASASYGVSPQRQHLLRLQPQTLQRRLKDIRMRLRPVLPRRRPSSPPRSGPPSPQSSCRSTGLPCSQKTPATRRIPASFSFSRNSRARGIGSTAAQIIVSGNTNLRYASSGSFTCFALPPGHKHGTSSSPPLPICRRAISSSSNSSPSPSNATCHASACSQLLCTRVPSISHKQAP